MKNNLLLAMAVATLGLSTPPDSQAYTVDEILANGNTAQEILTTSLNLGCYPDLGYTTTFEKIDDTHIRLNNFGNFGTAFELTLCNNNLVETRNGTKLKIDFQTATTTTRTLLPGVLAGFYSSGSAAYNFNNEPSWHLTIGKNDDGIIYLTSDNVVAYRIGSETPPDARIFHKVEYVFYTPNANASHYRTTYRPTTDWFGQITGVSKGRPVKEEFQARVELDEAAGTFRIMNFTNYGIAEDRDNNRHYITGTLDVENKTLKFDEDQAALSLLYVEPYWGTNWAEYWLPYVLRATDENVKYFYSELTGTYSKTALAHNDAEEAWVTNDGKRRTTSGFSLSVNEDYSYTYYDAVIPGQNAGFVPDNLNWHDVYSQAVYDGVDDETVDVELGLTQVGTDDSNLGVWGQIVTNKNHQNVDHYELYVVPGKFKSINDADFTHSVDLGHVSAKSIHEYNQDSHKPLAQAMAYAASASDVHANDYSFAKKVPFADLGDGFTLDNKNYTFFVKTVYKPETELTPTFHSMQYVEDNMVTGIDDLEAEIEDADAPVEYYNMMGVRVQEPVEGEIYVRRQGTKAEKVIYRH